MLREFESIWDEQTMAPALLADKLRRAQQRQKVLRVSLRPARPAAQQSQRWQVHIVWHSPRLWHYL